MTTAVADWLTAATDYAHTIMLMDDQTTKE